ncbi:MAG: hypothetical protein ABII26_00235 [Pseudomonadota bacterium]
MRSTRHRSRNCAVGFISAYLWFVTAGILDDGHTGSGEASGFDLPEAFGLDPGIIEILKEKYGPEFLPIQEKAFKEH